MKKLIFIFCLFLSIGASAQRIYRVEGQPQRFVNALGIPVMPASYYNNSSDTALIFLDRNDTTTISFKFKGLVKKLGGSRLPWDSLTGVPSNFSTTYGLSNDIQDSILTRLPYENATRSLNMGNYRVSARGLLGDTLFARTSAGGFLATNSGSVIASFGAGGSTEIDFHGFAGYNANRALSYTVRSFTDKNYVDSADALRVRYTDTAAMLSGYKTYYPRTAISAGTGISYNAATGVITNTSPSSGGTVTSVATNNGSGITGGTITTTGTIAADTSILSTKANVVGLLVGYATTAANALKLNISDTATMLSNYRRKTTLIENNDLRNSAITINGSSTSLGSSISVGTVTSVAASAGTGISISGSPITSSGTITITNTAPDQTVGLTGGTGISISGTYPNFTITNSSPSSGGTVTSVSAGIGMNFTTITSTGAVNADTTVLSTKANVTGALVAKANTSLNNVNGVLSSTYGGAGSVSGILKANGSGVVSAAVAGTDYVAPSALSGYVDLTSAQTISGVKTFTSVINADLAGGVFMSADAATTAASAMKIQNSGSSLFIGLDDNTGSTFGGGAYATNILSSGGSVDMNFWTNGVNRLKIAGGGAITAYGQINGTSLSMSGIGLFNGATDDGTNKLIVNGGVKASGNLTTQGEAYLATSGGKVGIGTASPTDLLTLERSSNSGSGSQFPTLTVRNTLATQGDGSSTFNFSRLYVSSGNDAVAMQFSTSFANGVWEPQGLISVLTNHPLIFRTNNTERLRISNTGAATFSSSVTASTDISSGSKFRINGNGAVPTASALEIGTNGVGSRLAYNVPTGGEHNLTVNGTTYFYVNASGAGSSGSITASSLIKSGGTSSQALIADGSVISVATAATASTIVQRDGSGNINAGTGLFTSANSTTIRARSGSSSDFATISVGRTSGELIFASVAVNGQFLSNSVVADAIIKADNTSQNMLFGFGTGPSALSIVGSTNAATFAGSVYAQGYRFAYAAKSSNYTLTDNDDYINVTSSCTITLPTAVGRSGKRYVIKCTGSAVATIASTSSQTIDGNAASTYTFGGPNFNIMIVYSDGSNWFLEAWQTGI